MPFESSESGNDTRWFRMNKCVHLSTYQNIITRWQTSQMLYECKLGTTGGLIIHLVPSDWIVEFGARIDFTKKRLKLRGFQTSKKCNIKNSAFDSFKIYLTKKGRTAVVEDPTISLNAHEQLSWKNCCFKCDADFPAWDFSRLWTFSQLLIITLRSWIFQDCSPECNFVGTKIVHYLGSNCHLIFPRIERC